MKYMIYILNMELRGGVEIPIAVIGRTGTEIVEIFVLWSGMRHFFKDEHSTLHVNATQEHGPHPRAFLSD